MVESENFLVSEAQLNLGQARKEKAQRLKGVGEPIELLGKPLSIDIHDGIAWIAENTTVVRKLDLETGKTLKVLKGHTGPVASLAFCPKQPGDKKREIIITGSWDRSIKVWNLATQQLISTTPNAHLDFVKSLHVFPKLGLLVSGGSDKIIRFWDISNPESREPLRNMGFISSHTRPVECLDGHSTSDDTASLYTGDTMGVIKAWQLNKEKDSTPPRWTATLKHTYDHHRTRINELRYGNGYLWTASADDTAQVIPSTPEDPSATLAKAPKPLVHPVAVRALLPLDLTDLGEPYLITAAGDVLRTYDVSTIDQPELLGQVDAHWHDITSIRLWNRATTGEDGKTRVEPWIVTTSLDRTIRKWKLSYLLNPPPPLAIIANSNLQPVPEEAALTEEEERELAELMEDD
ncbi:WD40-repeat-containing domain protein [Crepidotus variabilis]|uniref:WD40-repeat-containing domain protein n=1 Tax=Crepidotus variabilis TaxID=179855 RepID=A0A9P6ENZ6_9AGAR|nr:WD40-repeat-containing domain protein [Crepidotus variabilis]